MNITDKIEGSAYTPAEFNQFKNEIMNLETSAGQTLASTSVQLKQAVARYCANADSYTDSGIADAYSLTPISTNDKPSVYNDGLKVFFVAGNTNTGSSTLAISGLTTKTIKKNDFADNLEAGDIVAGRVYGAYYDSSSGFFQIADFAGGGGGAGGGILPASEASKTAVYTVLVGDIGTRIELGSGTASDIKFTLDVSLFADSTEQISFINKSDYRLQIEVSNTGTMNINDTRTYIMIWKGDGVVTLNGDTATNCNTVAGY